MTRRDKHEVAGIAGESDELAGTRYSAVRRLGRGAAGTVFEANHREVGKRVAVKLLHAHLAGDERILERLTIEAQAQARIDHPNLVPVHDVGTTPDGRPFYVMPLLVGRSLQEELDERDEILAREARGLVLELLEALSAVHREGVHRDVKPSNIFLCERPRTLKLLDLGVLKVAEHAQLIAPPKVVTQVGISVGTPRYMSPEAARGRQVDARADLYSVGLVLYRMIAGRGPFDDHASVCSMLIAQVKDEPEPPSIYASQHISPEARRAGHAGHRQAAGRSVFYGKGLRARAQGVALRHVFGGRAGALAADSAGRA